MKIWYRLLLTTTMVIASMSVSAQAGSLPLCSTPDQVLSGTRLTLGKLGGYFDWQSRLEGFTTRPVFHLDFVTCIPDIVTFNVGTFMTRDAQLFELQPRGLVLRGAARHVDPAYHDRGEERRCSTLSATADICIERASGQSVVFIEKHDPPKQRIPIIISRTRPIKGFAFLGSPDTTAGMVSLMIDRRTGYDFIMFDVYQAP